MLRPKQISAGIVSLAKVVARVVVAACLALSFFASLLPLRASADAGAMACCAGKAGHCNSGLVAKQQAKPEPKREPKPAPKPEPDRELMCGQKPSAGPKQSIADAGADAVTQDVETVDANEQAQDATQSSTPDASAALQSATLTKPCPADCRAGAAGVVRKPRPREIALLAKNIRGRLPESANWKPHTPETNLAAAATLKRSRPRGPPSSS